MSLPDFPFDDISLESFATAFRAGRIRSRDVTQAILARIDALATTSGRLLARRS